MIDKAIYSYWSKPNNKKNTNIHIESSFIDCMQLSLIYSKKWFSKVELYTDVDGYELLINKHKLKFTDVRIVLDTINYIKNRHWSLGKIFACFLQDEPFIHIDNDAIFFKRPPNYILNSDCAFQSTEGKILKNNTDFPYYKYQLEEAQKWNTFNIDLTKNNAYNCGIIAFNKIDKQLFDTWLKKSLDYINSFDKMLSDTNEKSIISCLIFEQYFIARLVENFNLNVDFLFLNKKNKLTAENSKRASELGFTHLMAAKKNKEVQNKIKARLQKELNSQH